jgi:hypothetical protein
MNPSKRIKLDTPIIPNRLFTYLARYLNLPGPCLEALFFNSTFPIISQYKANVLYLLTQQLRIPYCDLTTPLATFNEPLPSYSPSSPSYFNPDDFSQEQDPFYSY